MVVVVVLMKNGPEWSKNAALETDAADYFASWRSQTTASGVGSSGKRPTGAAAVAAGTRIPRGFKGEKANVNCEMFSRRCLVEYRT